MTDTDKERSKLSVEAWVDQQSFESTDDIEIPEMMADRVIGQDRAVEIMRKAALQKRHVMLIGEPGTGKSMLANSMVEFLPKDELEDVVAYHNPQDFNEPRIRVLPAGRQLAHTCPQCSGRDGAAGAGGRREPCCCPQIGGQLSGGSPSPCISAAAVCC